MLLRTTLRNLLAISTIHILLATNFGWMFWSAKRYEPEVVINHVGRLDADDFGYVIRGNFPSEDLYVRAILDGEVCSEAVVNRGQVSVCYFELRKVQSTREREEYRFELSDHGSDCGRSFDVDGSSRRMSGSTNPLYGSTPKIDGRHEIVTRDYYEGDSLVHSLKLVVGPVSKIGEARN